MRTLQIRMLAISLLIPLLILLLVFLWKLSVMASAVPHFRGKDLMGFHARTGPGSQAASALIKEREVTEHEVYQGNAYEYKEEITWR